MENNVVRCDVALTKPLSGAQVFPYRKDKLQLLPFLFPLPGYLVDWTNGAVIVGPRASRRLPQEPQRRLDPAASYRWV